MKTILNTSLIAAIAIVLCSCSQHKEENHDHETDKVKEIVQEPNDGLRLNDGQPWIANAETTEGMMKMNTLMDQFEESNNVADYAALSKALQVEFMTVIQKCTMVGEEHNQLHLYIVPMKSMFTQMESEDLGDCQAATKELAAQLKLYQKYFR